MFMSEESKQRLESAGWEFMGHSRDPDWGLFREHLSALQADTRFQFTWGSPLLSASNDKCYSVWKRKAV